MTMIPLNAMLITNYSAQDYIHCGGAQHYQLISYSSNQFSSERNKLNSDRRKMEASIHMVHLKCLSDETYTTRWDDDAHMTTKVAMYPLLILSYAISYAYFMTIVFFNELILYKAFTCKKVRIWQLL
ncbi:unnamed protein product [Owenia fusiformis]|uniref:Uncharacterized protein n=1 Tax=Owenia fusiformis TaxID=6347 RepID=A0A8J1XKD9_OWEFU|nr:unnamed protein product [Owenia fusiformis]